jgi:glyoxylase-like metal-dependent hydrolase (beta-lactamase superfamily II)
LARPASLIIPAPNLGIWPDGGEIVQSLKASGVEAGAVTKIIYTHAHPDHLFGSVTADDDMAAKTRRPFLDYVSHGKKKFLGYHCAYPGLCMAEVKDGAFAYVPAV